MNNTNKIEKISDYSIISSSIICSSIYYFKTLSRLNKRKNLEDFYATVN